MIKYIGEDTCSALLKFNTETTELSRIESKSSNVDWVYIVDEDGILEDTPVKAGDIIFRMYKYEGLAHCPYFIIPSENLKKYYSDRDEICNKHRKEVYIPSDEPYCEAA